jgi:arylsulfatase A-like enzyme
MKTNLNLIFITIDGARKDHIIKGDNYQKLIKKSSFFSKVIAYTPFTIAAMHAVFSGTYGTKNGVNSYWSSENFKKLEFKTLTKYLHDEGYITHADIINDLILPAEGFDEFNVHDELQDNLTTKHEDLLERAKKWNENGKKFFLYLHYSNIHTGIMENVLKKYDNFSEEYFSNRKENEKRYWELFKKGDDYLGKILEKYEKLEFQEDTLLVIISDHGISVGEKIGERAYGVFCYDYTLISTALFYHKNLPKISIDSQIRSIDILPTILDVMKINQDSKYKKMQGESLISILNGNKENRIAFSQSGNPLKNKEPPEEPNVWAIRTEKWKLIKNLHNDTEELYDLENDPSEENNLIGTNSDIEEDLRKKLIEISQN